MTEDVLVHYGTPRHSGRYPWGSGKDPMQSGRSFLGQVDELKRHGLSNTEIARSLGMSTTEFRARQSIEKNAQRQADAAQAVRLQAKGMSTSAIARQMGKNESSVRALLAPSAASKRNSLQVTAKLLQDKVDEGGFLDIGSGTENHLGISATKLSTAVAILKQKGYVVKPVQVLQQGTGKKTTIKVLAPPGTTYGDIARNMDKIRTIAAYSEDGGATYSKIQPPVSISSKRVAVRYAEDGGAAADGVIYVRPGVEDVSLGSSRYAQVRIAVDGTHYLKGMAMYKEGLPPGVDLVFNTNKHNTGNPLDAMKAQKEDPINPFGSMIKRQRKYTGADGKEHLSVMNIVNEQGDWADWRRTLSSQVLSKQHPTLAKRQLDFALAHKKDELEEILRLTNPVVKKRLLDAFANEADSDSVHLRAAALPRQGTHVILPFEKMKESEIYAPNYDNGTRVALIRFPHGGTFEIPELTVNNKHPEARKTLGAVPDVVGIHPKVAERLSGADFDGDTVLVIPNNRGDVQTSPPLRDLKNFDPKTHYPPYDGMRTIDGGTYNAKTKKVDYGGRPPSGSAKQHQMGDVSNLITDMTIKGASHEEIARAVRHSMVVIDAEKHSLNVKQSYIDNNIAQLKEKYQGRGPTGRLRGASTIVSRSTSQTRVPERRLRRASEGGPIDTKTGEKVYVPTGRSHVTRTGKLVKETELSTQLAEARDARALSSGTPIEEIYAAHSNSLKSLANQARRESLKTGKLQYSDSAYRTYRHEVDRLNAALDLAHRNRPLERQAQLVANTLVEAKRRDNPGMDSDELKKVRGQALETARARVGAKKHQIEISPKEWEAIQAGAVTTNKLNDIIGNADLDKLKGLATPRTATVVTPTKLSIAKARIASGYTQAEVAASLGIPVSTLNSALLREGG